MTNKIKKKRNKAKLLGRGHYYNDLICLSIDPMNNENLKVHSVGITYYSELVPLEFYVF